MSFFWRVGGGGGETVCSGFFGGGGGGGGVNVCLGISWGFVGNPGDFLGF